MVAPDVDALSADELEEVWNSDHNKHLEDDTTHPEVTRTARAMLARYVSLRGDTIIADLRALGDTGRKELRHRLARRLRSSRTLVERATVLLLPQAESAEAELPPLVEGRALVDKITALGEALSALRGVPYTLRIRDSVRPSR